MDKKNHYHQDMLSVEEARKKILDNFAKLGVERTPILECLGMTLAKGIVSPISVPPLNNSAMDGYAIMSLDTKKKLDTDLLELKVIGTVAAGEISNKTIKSGQALRIMTGAPIPAGSDAVVPFENTDEQKRKLRGSSNRKIAIMAKVDSGENIRLKGEDIFVGATVLHKNKIIRPADIGVAASIGLTHLPVIRRPVIAIFSTGNELVEPGNKLSEGKIYNSNAFTVASMVSSYGGIPKIIDTAEDSFQAVDEALSMAMAGADMVVTSAGVSKGDYDVVKDVLEKKGEISLWSVRMRPAKPLAFGVLDSPHGKKIPHLGLPGNPVSAMVAFIQFGRQAIGIMMGRSPLPNPTITAILDDSINNFDRRRVYARVYVYKSDEGDYRARITGNQSSGVLTSMAAANGLGICPEGIDRINTGEKIQVEMIDWPEEIF